MNLQPPRAAGGRLRIVVDFVGMAQVRPDQIGDIYDRWVRRGRPYCEHDRYGTIQDVGTPPEEYCCLICGETWSMGFHSKTPPPRGDVA